MLFVISLLYLVFSLQNIPGEENFITVCNNTVLSNEEDTGGICYGVSNGKVDWETANAMCILNGGRLAKILNTEMGNEIYRIVNIKNRTEDYWIGRRRVGNSTQFEWTNGTNTIYGNSVDGINCIAINAISSKWELFKCTEVKYFICEKDVCSSWKVRNGICYKKFDQNLNSIGAVQLCEQESAYLAEVPNIYVNNIVSGLLESGFCWIGLVLKNTNYSWRIGEFPLEPNQNSLNDTEITECASIRFVGSWSLRSCSNLRCSVCMKGPLTSEAPTERCMGTSNDTIVDRGYCYTRIAASSNDLDVTTLQCSSFNGVLYKYNDTILNRKLLSNYNINFGSDDFGVQDPDQYNSFIPQNGYFNLITSGVTLPSPRLFKLMRENGTLENSILCQTCNYICKSDYAPDEVILRHMVTNEMCYWSVAGNENWAQADTHCAATGGHLVEILDPHQYDIVISLLATEDEYLDEFYWAGIGESLLPNITGNSSCTALDRNGSWIGSECSNKFSYICSRNINSQDTYPCDPIIYSTTALSTPSTTAIPTAISTALSTTPSTTPIINETIIITLSGNTSCSGFNSSFPVICTFLQDNPYENSSGVDFLFQREVSLKSLITELSITAGVAFQIYSSDDIVLVIIRVGAGMSTEFPVGDNEIRVNTNSFQGSTTLLVLNTGVPNESDDFSNSSTFIVSDVITIVTSYRLSGNLTIVFEIKDVSNDVYDISTVRCVFLNTDGNWLYEGVETLKLSDGYIDCVTNHLSTFALLVSSSPLCIDFNKIDVLILVISNYTILSISLLFLLTSLILFLLSAKTFFKIDVNILHFNHTLALILAIACFLFGVKMIPNASLLCIVVAFLLHFLWTNVFLASLSIAILVFYSIWVVGIKHKARRIYPWLIAIGWLVSLLWAVLWLTIGKLTNQYLNSDIQNSRKKNCEVSCFLSTNIISSFIVPIFLILVINFSVLFLSLYKIRLALKKKNNSESEYRRLRRVVTAAILLLPAFSLPFIISLPLAFSHLYSENEEIKTLFNWVFTITNAPLGIVHFLLITYQSTEVTILKRIRSKVSKENSSVTQFSVGSNKLNSTQALNFNVVKKSVTNKAKATVVENSYAETRV